MEESLSPEYRIFFAVIGLNDGSIDDAGWHECITECMTHRTPQVDMCDDEMHAWHMHMQTTNAFSSAIWIRETERKRPQLVIIQSLHHWSNKASDSFFLTKQILQMLYTGCHYYHQKDLERRGLWTWKRKGNMITACVTIFGIRPY